MTTLPRASRRNIAVLAGLIGQVTLATAQAPLMDHQLGSAVWFDAQVPTFSGGGPSAVLLMNPGLRVALTRGGTLELVTEVPIMSATPPFSVFGNNSNATLIGNPYLGARITQGPRWYDFGVRLPFARANVASGNYPDTAGIFGDFDRHEAYVPDQASITAGLTQSSFTGRRGFGTRFSLNGSVDVPVRSRSGQRTDFYANADVLIGYVNPVLAVLAGITINARLNNSQNAYGEAVSEQLVVGTILRTRYVRPMLGLRVPLSSDLSRLVKIVYQAGVTVGTP